MGMAWEVTEDDVKQVLSAHKVKFTDEIFDLVDADKVEDYLLGYVDFDNQVVAALSQIESQLIYAGVLSEPKKFLFPENAEDDCIEY